MDPLPWLAAAALAVAVVVLVSWRWRRRILRRIRLRKGRVATRYPVVLLHGVLGFEEIRLGPARHAYFRGVSERLEGRGGLVHRPTVPKAAALERRAEALARYLAELDAPRVNLVAHSMGGIDARHVVAHLGLASRVASVITVGTPHRGTPLADMGASVLSRRLGMRRVLAMLRCDAFYDLTQEEMERFNARTPDVRGVFYGCVVGAPRRGGVSPLLVASHRYLESVAGPNDGVVPSGSQVWGEVLAEVDADHWAQIGWSTRFDAAALYEEVSRELRGLGL